MDIILYLSNGYPTMESSIQMAREYIPDDFVIRQMRAEYKKSAVLGDMIYP